MCVFDDAKSGISGCFRCAKAYSLINGGPAPRLARLRSQGQLVRTSTETVYQLCSLHTLQSRSQSLHVRVHSKGLPLLGNGAIGSKQ